MSPARSAAVVLGFGFAHGFVVSRLGVSSYDEVRRMVTFADPRLWLVFMTTVAIAAVGFLVLNRHNRWGLPENRIHRGTIVGGILFGTGWALTGACPGVVLVQLGEGRIAALFTIAGVLVGNWLYGKAHARWFRWDPGSCDF